MSRTEKEKRPIVAISGGFSLVHKGHLDYIEEAGKYGDVHVYLNSDEWLIRKKGFVFQSFEDRARLLWAIKGVTMVIPAEDDDNTVCKTIQTFRPQFFAKGGDRTCDNTPEAELCGHLGIEVLYGVGGEKSESSSNILNRFAEWVKEDSRGQAVPIEGVYSR